MNREVQPEPRGQIRAAIFGTPIGMALAKSWWAMTPLPKEDMHVHSTFSDGMHSVSQNVESAELRGLARMCCVDHVRRDTEWVAEFADAVEAVNARSSIRVFSGVEAKFLDEYGTLDVPADLSNVDFVYAADHQFPMGSRCLHPGDVKCLLAQGALTPELAIQCLIRATHHAIARYDKVVVAHFLSILPKIGLDESMVSLDDVRTLALYARERGAAFEIDERWRCPSPRIIEVLLEQEVPVFLSTDSHRRETIGVYDYATTTLQAALEAP
jgi:putative hydrolase